MTHRCDVCKAPAGYRYKNQWNCKAHYQERRRLWTAFEVACKTPSKCLRPGMLPACCERCGYDPDGRLNKDK